MYHILAYHHHLHYNINTLPSSRKNYKNAEEDILLVTRACSHTCQTQLQADSARTSSSIPLKGLPNHAITTWEIFFPKISTSDTVVDSKAGDVSNFLLHFRHWKFPRRPCNGKCKFVKLHFFKCPTLAVLVCVDRVASVWILNSTRACSHACQTQLQADSARTSSSIPLKWLSPILQ